MHFRDLNESQILALAITAEEEDGRIYRDYAAALRADFPATADLFTRMADEESNHRHRLIELYRAAIRRAHPADAAAGRERIHAAAAVELGARAAAGKGSGGSGADGDGGAAFLRSRRATLHRRVGPATARRSRA